MNMITLFAMLVMICIPTAFSLVVFGYDKQDSGIWFMMAIILFGAGAVAFGEALRRARIEDANKEERMGTLIAEVRGLRNDIRHRGDNLDTPKK